MAHHKYSRTLHLPFSMGRTDDDKVLKSTEHFEGKEVVATYKMDGENTSLYSDLFHARSLDSRHHSSRDWLAAFHATIAHDIPDGWRICGENLFARHSLAYDDLPSYFMGFSVWDESNTALSWDDSKEFMELLGITPVAELYRGVFDEALLRKLADTLDTDKHEGFVVRLAREFEYDDFGLSVAKWVRPHHVQTDAHWMHAAVVANGLRVPANPRGRTAFEARLAKVAAVSRAQDAGEVADSLDVRLTLLDRVRSGELTLAGAQAELARLQRGAKASGLLTRSQVFSRG